MKKQGMTRRIWTTCLCMAMFLPLTLSAQNTKSEKDFNRGWYVGAQAGMPMAEADFSSFGADRFRPGWTAGLYGGYRFTPVWSLEMSASWGQQFLAEQDCCYERGYFLGADHNRYRYVIPEGLDGWYYKDLKSRTFVQRYGLQVNMNVLGFFNRTRESRWRLEVSPAVYAVGTSSDLMTKADESPVADNLREWHLGFGGNAHLSYAIANNINIGIYGGFTHLTGDPMDGMPELHSTNFIVDAGVKFGFAFGAKKRAVKSVAAVAPAVVEEPRTECEEQNTVWEKAVVAETPVVATATEEQPVEVAVAEEPVSSVVPSEVGKSPNFPVIYFSFNSIWIEPSERAKVKEIADMMKTDESIRIRITGWGDSVGSEAANKRVSLQRAEAVKRALGRCLIPAERVETVGGGVNRDAASDAEARKATVIEYR